MKFQQPYRVLFALLLLLAVRAGFSQEIKSIKITDLEKIIEESNKPLVINFWATWCQPCIEELPYLLQATKENGVELLLVSLDFKEAYPAAIQKFIKRRKITAAVQWLDETNADYFCPRVDSNWSGAIPATLFINNKTQYHQFYEEKLTKEKLEQEIQFMLWKPQ